jgi:two-component system CheB/CheR fusion protein
MRVLIVEDFADTAETEAMLLRMYGHEVETARDGQEALKKFAEFRPRAVILDIGLPRLDGWSLARKIRETSGAETLLIALTGYGLPQDRVRSEEAGINRHLLKPIDPDELFEILKNYQDGSPP